MTKYQNTVSIKITKLKPGRGFEPRRQKAEAFEATVIPLDYPGIRNHSKWKNKIKKSFAHNVNPHIRIYFVLPQSLHPFVGQLGQ